ncbi:MAG: sulfotransferase [Acidimicrobiales bacterium]|nr:sulfotransferase [Acidimicrobiales bacterium]
MDDLVVIGAMKSATTTVYSWLAPHPQIRQSAGKEVNFYNDDRLWAKGFDWYEQQFEPAGTVRFDCSPNYSKRHLWPDVANRMFADNRSASIVYVVREPYDRVVSHYIHSVAAGREARGFDQVLDDADNEYIAATRYMWQLEPFLERAGFVSVLRFDDVVRDPAGVLGALLQSLGLDPTLGEPVTSGRNESSSKTRPSALARRIPRSRSLLRRINTSLAERPIVKPDKTPDRVGRVRELLRDDLARLNESGLVDITDWLA